MFTGAEFVLLARGVELQWPAPVEPRARVRVTPKRKRERERRDETLQGRHLTAGFDGGGEGEAPASRGHAHADAPPSERGRAKREKLDCSVGRRDFWE